MNLPIQERIGLLDLTRLEAVKGDEAAVEALCGKARTPYGDVAAVCIHPAYVGLAKGLLQGSAIATATVVNFPSGDCSLKDLAEEVQYVLRAGADELDVVIPYKAWLAGDRQAVHSLMEAMHHWLDGHARIKAILETGAVSSSAQRLDMAREVAASGVNFLKTSTGKIPIGATPEAVMDLLQVAEEYRSAPRAPGIKIAGGVRTAEQADAYLAMIESRMGRPFLVPEKVRIGASSLLDDLLSKEIS